MEIGVWGDSIAYGTCDSRALGWVGRLRKSLFGTDTRVYNFGVGGDSTKDLLKRFSVEADSIEPDIVIFASGINDSKIPKDGTDSVVPLERYRSNIRRLVEMAKCRTDNIYLIGATKIEPRDIVKSPNRFDNDIIHGYNRALEEIARSEQVEFIDVFDVLDTETDLADGLHPNDHGYEKLYRSLVGSLASTLNR